MGREVKICSQCSQLAEFRGVDKEVILCFNTRHQQTTEREEKNMRFFEKTKDGGKESTVDAFFLCEIKGLFSVALLRFNKGSRNNFHSHAFHAFTWFLKGDMEEHRILDGEVVKRKYKRSFLPKLTKRDNLHKVIANKTSWCFTVRGKWHKEWQEVDLGKDELITLSNGRKIEKVEKANLKDLVGGMSNVGEDDLLTEQEAVFKVNQAIGSMSVEGIVLTEKQKQAMLRIVQGYDCADSLREKWIVKYSKLKS